MGDVSARTALASSLISRRSGCSNLQEKKIFLKGSSYQVFQPLTTIRNITAIRLHWVQPTVTLFDLTAAYMAIANAGIYLPLKLTQGNPSAAGRRIMAEKASYIITDIHF
jgi:membrane carboxypeptidase/penicillin-binding protein PbpC